ncbi:MAG: type I restriction endonuclease subunit R [Paludibacteraceae bacterium]|nr:type I restriction endonuclease subunit R [Paludibacteraceae bacterium]
MSHFNESSLEYAIIELFKQQGYEYADGREIAKEEGEVLLADDLRAYLKSRYADDGITDTEVNRVLAKLKQESGVSHFEQNAITLRLMTEGFAIKRDDTKKPDLYVEPIDFAHPERNTWKIVNQLKIRGREYRIPDGIVYVNGLPLVVMEFKNAVKTNTTIENAHTQLAVRYKRDIPELFKYNAFVVISDGVNNRYGALTTPYEYFYSWKKAEADDKDAEGVASLRSMVEGLFRKDRLLSVVHDFIYIPDNTKRETKIICRYPQYFAAKKLQENIAQHCRINIKGDGKGGTYFGSTGCGKSYTMLFLTRLLMHDRRFANPTIVLITDRTDLDTQLSQQFMNARKYIGDDCVRSITSRDNLRAELQGRKSGGVFLTTIQKFTEDTLLLSDRANIICISDEAHRSQVNMQQKVTYSEDGVRKSYGFAKYLHDSLPNATYVGFTGTPVDATIDVFGPVVDSYTMRQSVEDGITKRIVYEGRAAKVMLSSEKLKEIEEYYDKCADEGASEYQIEESKRAVSKMEVIIGDPERLKAVAKDIVAHYEKRIEEGSSVKGKAMIVCINRKVAYELYKDIESLRPEWTRLPEQHGEDLAMAAEPVPLYKKAAPIEKMKMIMTYNRDDEESLYDILDADSKRTDIETQFKDPDSDFKIAIVVDMWTTGFDVPSLDTMYIDKPLQKHTLIQTISRVNRQYEGKDKGLVVDYFGIRRKMDDALALYNNGDNIGTSVEETEKSVAMVKDELDILRRMFGNFDYEKFITGSELEQLETLNEGAELMQGTKERETLFMGHTKKLKAAFNMCLSSEEITDKDRGDIHYFCGVRSIIYKLTRGESPDATMMNKHVTEMIRAAMESSGVEEIMHMGGKPMNIDMLSDEYLERIDNIQLPNTKLKLLEKLTRMVISEFQKVNKVKAMSFTERFNKLMESYNARKDDQKIIQEILDEIAEQMKKIIKDVKEEKDSVKDMGISFEEKAFYDILVSVAKKYGFSNNYTDAQYKEMAKKVKALVDDKSKYTDWDNREDIKAELKMDLIMLLSDYDYPPQTYDETYKEIFEQTENFKKYRMNPEG